MTWHYLQISDTLDREFCSALSELTALVAWEPKMNFWGWAKQADLEKSISDPPIQQVCQFPLQRGFARMPFFLLAQFGRKQTQRMRRKCADPAATPLVCSTPYHAWVAEKWPGPVVYYLTDLISAYKNANDQIVQLLDVRMCQRAQLVCPNSQRIADYLIQRAECDPSKIVVVPNATRRSNLLTNPLKAPTCGPSDISGLRRPIAGVIGNLAANLDWNFLLEIIEQNPSFTWIFVGPTSMRIDDIRTRRMRERVMKHSKAKFIGRKSYGELASYARAFDVGILPYDRREPTFSGSATRFYEHLAACRPMIATGGVDELSRKPPLVHLVETPEQATRHLRHLESVGFDDGHIEARWIASQEGTWSFRAATMYSALNERLKFAKTLDALTRSMLRSSADQTVTQHEFEQQVGA